MPIQVGPSEKVRELIEALGGHIWSSVTDMVAGGAATARTAIESHRVPDAARTLLGWRPIDVPNAQAAAESAVAVFDIGGVNFKYQPQEVIGGNVANSLLVSGGMKVAASEYYDVFAPVSGGETIDIGVEPIDAIAGNRRSGAELTWTDISLPLPPIYSLCSREIAMQALGDFAGTLLGLNNAHKLIEVDAIASFSTATVQEEAAVTLTLRCTVWEPVQTLAILLEPAAPAGVTPADAGNLTVTRRMQRLKFNKETANVEATFNLDGGGALTAAGQAAHGIRWI